ncbi:hypothetical protein EIK77_006107 [Talaromyces pinophilus]|nr:hypothetical protein EIK77_006107 [Talaromyces pinophilus]
MSIAPAMEDNDHECFPYGLSKTTPTYEYQNAAHYSAVLSRQLDRLRLHQDTSDYVIFTNINQEQLSRDFQESTDWPFESYFPRLQVLLTKLETDIHANAARKFEFALLRKLSAMNGLDKQLDLPGAALVKTPERSKKADNSYKPHHGPKYRNKKWPTLAVEVAYSESWRKLANDARWWLAASNGDIKTIITISINQKYREITCDKWGLNAEEEPVALYRVQMQRDAGCEHVKISNKDPLIIRFEDLFLRPSQDACDGDVVFSQDDLKELASMIWRVQFDE